MAFFGAGAAFVFARTPCALPVGFVPEICGEGRVHAVSRVGARGSADWRVHVVGTNEIDVRVDLGALGAVGAADPDAQVVIAGPVVLAVECRVGDGAVGC